MSKQPYYSKKVIKHFTNPKNFGEIKNADGVGRVGNPACVLPKQNIHINNDLKCIEKISIENKILSHNGLYNKIDKTFKRDYDGQILIIKNRLGVVQLTPEHLILSLKLPKENKFLRTKNKKNLICAWHHVEELKKGDIVAYPILREEKDLKYIEINTPKSKWDFNSKKIPNKILVNSDLLKLFGYFLSEGNVCDKPCKTFILFTLNINEEEIAKDIERISKRLFNLKVTIKKRPERNTMIVSLYSAELARFFKNLFGSQVFEKDEGENECGAFIDCGAGNKKIPNFIMELPLKKQKALIYGLWKGDGYINLDRIGPRGGYVTISHKLVQQIKTLLLRQKIIPSIYEEKEQEIRGVKHKKAYRIHVGQRSSLIKLCSILGIKYHSCSYLSESGWFDDKFLYIPITEIKKKKYVGEVYNFEIKDTHSFTSEAFCLHNCGDIMTLYIKIGQKAGKEIIKEIKFHTLGCPAAIATSDIACDLVKGKTLKQALKVGHKDIVGGLIRLPPIKIHCSLLAEQGIKAAIEDYENKKNKKETLYQNKFSTGQKSSCGNVRRCGFKCDGCFT